MKEVNLSRRPFVNARPLVRLATLLWLVGAALLALNLWLYVNYWADSAEIRGQLGEVDEATVAEAEQIEQLGEDLERLDLEGQNGQVLYLNLLIANRTFPWSRLFDDLEDVLPREVRLNSVQPNVNTQEALNEIQILMRRSAARSASSARGRSAAEPLGRDDLANRMAAMLGVEEVQLRFRGLARTDDDLLEFVDALYASPKFREPILDNDSIDRSRGGLSFSLGVIYRLRIAAPEDGSTAKGSPAEVSPAEASSDATPSEGSGEPIDPEDAAVSDKPVAPAAGFSSAVDAAPKRDTTVAPSQGSAPPSRVSTPPSAIRPAPSTAAPPVAGAPLQPIRRQLATPPASAPPQLRRGGRPS